MSDKDEAIAEAMARAMSVAEGKDPDEIIDAGRRGEHYCWQAYYHSAKCQLAAHRAMIKAEKEQGE